MSVQNAGAIWWSSVKNKIREFTLDGINEKELYRKMNMKLNLRLRKATEIIKELEELEFIKEIDYKIYWIENEVEKKIIIENIRKEYDDYFNKCKEKKIEPEPYDIWARAHLKS